MPILSKSWGLSSILIKVPYLSSFINTLYDLPTNIIAPCSCTILSLYIDNIVFLIIINGCFTKGRYIHIPISTFRNSHLFAINTYRKTLILCLWLRAISSFKRFPVYFVFVMVAFVFFGKDMFFLIVFLSSQLYTNSHT